MIAQLRGKITHLEDRWLILDVNGVGYKIFTTAHNLQLDQNEEDTLFWTHLAVKEDALDLYGFRQRNELQFFELLLTVSGIGPKSALGILSLADPETLQKAISTGKSDYLTKVSGIGQKNAEKIILELKNKLGSFGAIESEESLGKEEDVLAALQALGYSLKEAREAVKKIPENVADTNERIREALKHVSK